MDKVIITLLGFFGIFFTFWFFLGKKTGSVEAVDSIGILVKGGYSPETISVKRGKKIKLNFLRKDKSSCLEEVVLSDFKIREFLPLNRETTIEITPQKTGIFNFSCGMGMFHGKLIVKD